MQQQVFHCCIVFHHVAVPLDYYMLCYWQIYVSSTLPAFYSCEHHWSECSFVCLLKEDTVIYPEVQLLAGKVCKYSTLPENNKCSSKWHAKLQKYFCCFSFFLVLGIVRLNQCNRSTLKEAKTTKSSLQYFHTYFQMSLKVPCSFRDFSVSNNSSVFRVYP